PQWRPQARGLWMGMDRGTTRAHLARATLEGIAFQVYDLAETMRQESGHTLSRFQVDGGAAASNLLMQFQSDLLDAPVVRPKNLETTGLGAALLAGLGVGLWPRADALFGKVAVQRTFRPRMSAEARARHLAKWRRAVERA